MPPRNDEVNVFKIPHGRMLQLVNTCNKKLTITDFANNDELFSLLNNMQSVFIEFKSHEEIENEFIMKQLKSKLKDLAIHNSAVCNCHKDDEFTPLFQLVDMGYLHVNKTKTTSERINFGIKFRKALNQFTKHFLPHMKEEEEEFQPLLMKYFSENELVEMKNIVIKTHIQQRKTLTKQESSSIENEDINSDNLFDKLPIEIMINIFSNMNLRDKLKAACVSKYWNQLIYEEFFWKKLSFSEWNDTFGTAKLSLTDVFNRNHEDFEYEEESSVKNENIAEIRIVQFWMKFLLPRIGNYIKELDLNNCKIIDNNITRRILQLCPNLKILNLSYTKISGNTFRGVSLNRLEHLNCEGCENLSDDAFKYLLLSSCNTNESNKNLEKSCQNENINLFDNLKTTVTINNIEEIKNIEDMETCNIKKNKKSECSLSLQYINLSGCWLITDVGLGSIASKYDLTNLNYLNLSGCINLSALGMSLLVEMSKTLNGANLYYCDNIVDGPMKETANSCDNYCGNKFCCRSNLC